jgi:hypothetical protein
MEALDHLARTVLEHAPALHRAGEEFAQVELRLFGAVLLDLDAGAAAEHGDGQQGSEEPVQFLDHDGFPSK